MCPGRCGSGAPRARVGGLGRTFCNPPLDSSIGQGGRRRTGELPLPPGRPAERGTQPLRTRYDGKPGLSEPLSPGPVSGRRRSRTCPGCRRSRPGTGTGRSPPGPCTGLSTYSARPRPGRDGPARGSRPRPSGGSRTRSASPSPTGPRPTRARSGGRPPPTGSAPQPPEEGRTVPGRRGRSPSRPLQGTTTSPGRRVRATTATPGVRDHGGRRRGARQSRRSRHTARRTDRPGGGAGR